jgi:WD40 repeat protein
VNFLVWLWTTAAFFPSPTWNILPSTTGTSPVCRLVPRGSLSYQAIDFQPSNDRGDLGVTSTAAIGSISSDSTCLVALGTKFGDLVVLPLQYNNTWRLSQRSAVVWLPRIINSNINSPTSPRPIYSLATIGNESGMGCQLLAGGADRYVSVWKSLKHTKEQTSVVCDWEMVQRLGPHTGWIKSVLHVPSSQRQTAHANTIDKLPRHRLYSIGCNRIECWVYNENGKWMQTKTVAIDSSPPLIFSSGREPSVCTLSSDLLCLELCKIASPTQSDVIVFAAGGVDGRIHFFLDSETATRKHIDNIATVVGHQGRVNVLSFDEKSQLLFSGSHDGSVNCWQLSLKHGSSRDSDVSLSPKLIVCIVASYGFAADIRVTALSCSTVKPNLDCMNDSVEVLIGTQNGQIHLLSLVISRDELKSRRHNFVSCDFVHLGIESENLTGTRERSPIIHTFCRLIDNDFNTSIRRIPPSFIVGHSHGFGSVTMTRGVVNCS